MQNPWFQKGTFATTLGWLAIAGLGPAGCSGSPGTAADAGNGRPLPDSNSHDAATTEGGEDGASAVDSGGLEGDGAGQCGTSCVTAISAGWDSACALLSNGSVKCWGDNSNGQLGNGTTISSSKPVPVSGLTGVTAISVGNGSACALLSGGSVRCWGGNPAGVLGDGTTTDSLTPVTVSGLTGVTAISVGNEAACAILSDGSVRCWGFNNLGQLGDGTTTNSLIPVAVSGLSGVTAISAGNFSTCAILSGGSVQCWGINSAGQFGNGTTTSSSTPVAASGLSGVTAISVNNQFACGLLSGGSVQCWGVNLYGELGNGTSAGPDTCTILTGTNTTGACSTNPVATSGLTGATAISAGFATPCALLSGGSVECWGDNSYGELGNGATTGPQTCTIVAGANYTTDGACSTSPITVSGLSGVTAISSGYLFACALLSGGSVRCWGLNNLGQLGNGTTTNSSTPVAVAW
jgi:alpha-tubulin suppressor-like RCC1 family protein